MMFNVIKIEVVDDKMIFKLLKGNKIEDFCKMG